MCQPRSGPSHSNLTRDWRGEFVCALLGRFGPAVGKPACMQQNAPYGLSLVHVYPREPHLKPTDCPPRIDLHVSSILQCQYSTLSSPLPALLPARWSPFHLFPCIPHRDCTFTMPVPPSIHHRWHMYTHMFVCIKTLLPAALALSDSPGSVEEMAGWSSPTGSCLGAPTRASTLTATRTSPSRRRESPHPSPSPASLRWTLERSYAQTLK